MAPFFCSGVSDFEGVGEHPDGDEWPPQSARGDHTFLIILAVIHDSINFDGNGFNCGIWLELQIKFLHDMIKQSPVAIQFGNYVTLNKKLILGVRQITIAVKFLFQSTLGFIEFQLCVCWQIASQVVTYLIVLMQFVQPN